MAAMASGVRRKQWSARSAGIEARGALVALLALSGLGCSSRERLVPGIAVGRIVYHVGDDAPFCENDAQYLSDSLESLEELLGRRAAG